MSSRNRLALGTVQFGLAYGVSHEGGRVPLEEARRILELAARSGVDTLDTAAAYGDSETVLGEIAGEDSPFAVVTKTLPIRAETIDDDAAARVETAFRESLRRLRRKQAYALLVHDAGDILNPGGERVWTRLERLRAEGLVGKIGLSVYEGAAIEAAMDRFAIEILQAPLSVFDQRLLVDGALARAAGRRVEIHVRSALLQGLLLMRPDDAAARLPAAVERLRAWRGALAELGVAPLAAALGFALAQPIVAKVVVGVHSAAHLAECLAAAEAAPRLDYARFACDDPEIIDPRLWPK